MMRTSKHGDEEGIDNDNDDDFQDDDNGGHDDNVGDNVHKKLVLLSRRRLSQVVSALLFT